ncbi:uncharacterized protein LOC123400800 [Hordeum vulgare subsp. vulgare]|uniref:uncharacterized protein LOC123400800 n=1 Tax=Hordeum vulgare subsp. vulgare TaxID=112509 RepID=UPI001D1A5850|nr:uncharacterized protein LOC123400800 [Hordeum vulgare subsp. vulgare]
MLYYKQDDKKEKCDICGESRLRKKEERRTDWKHCHVEPQALYEAGGGKPHGKWSLFNGAVEGKETLREVQVNRSLSSSKRQRIQHDKRIAQHNELMKAHAQSMVDWGESVQATVESNPGGVNKFLMTIASLQGIPGPEIPCITIPPPPTFPTLTTSSPIFSPEMPSTGESANAAEHMDNTWCGAENGMFGGFFDANGNDANGVPVENFSPSCDDLPPF